MSALYMLIGFSLAVALVFLGAFLWALRSDQFRDTCPPAMRMLFDEQTPRQSDSGEEESL